MGKCQPVNIFIPVTEYTSCFKNCFKRQIQGLASAALTEMSYKMHIFQ